MYWDFNDLGKSNDLIMKLEINVLYLYIVVSCVPCVNLMLLRPVLVFEIPSGVCPSLFWRGKHRREFRPLILAPAVLDQHKRYKGPLLTGGEGKKAVTDMYCICTGSNFYSYKFLLIHLVEIIHCSRIYTNIVFCL